MGDRIERAQWTAQQAAAVAKSWFQVVEIPEEAHPALLAEYAKGAPDRDRYERIAQEWLDAHEWDPVAHKWRERKTLPPLPAPPKPTVAALRAEIQTERSEWIAQGNDRDNLFWAPRRLARWWNSAAQIEGTPPPPLMPAPLPGRVSDIQQAIGAANVLLRWCEAADTPRYPVPPAARAMAIINVEKMGMAVQQLNQTNNNPAEVNMQFNQTNNNAGEVNNAISEEGNVVQTMGTGNTVQVDHPEERFWRTLWEKIKAWWKWLVG
jgi:hypothetical protein